MLMQLIREEASQKAFYRSFVVFVSLCLLHLCTTAQYLSRELHFRFQKNSFILTETTLQFEPNDSQSFLMKVK